MMTKRFIELALHGGCSRKLGAGELSVLLASLSNSGGSPSGFNTWLDYGRFDLPGQVLVSNVDVVLPMVLSPADFGEIVISHVLSDIYAAGASPLFALNLLGISRDVSDTKTEVVEMLRGASRKLTECGTTLVGGHTMGDQQDFYYGLAIVGTVAPDKVISNDRAQPGDVLVLTKPLGTSIASSLWRSNAETSTEFTDVLDGMKQTNQKTASLLWSAGVHACTDITGFGFLGHAHNLLKTSKVAATIVAKDVPIYASVVDFAALAHPTRIWPKNFEFVKDCLDFKASFSPLFENVFFDAQVSGGLLLSLPSDRADELVESLRVNDVEARIIGEVSDGDPGYITVV